MSERSPIDPGSDDDGSDGSPRLRELADTWREHLRLDDLDREEARIAAELLETLAGETDRQEQTGADVRDRIEELAARGEVGSVWNAVEELHLGLDRAVAGGTLAADDAHGLRRLLTSVQARLHRAGLSARLSARRQLLRDVTHDLRVPLNSIVFLTDSLFDERHGELTETQRRKLGGVYSASATLLNFVNDLLDLSRSTEEDFECSFVPFSIQGVVEDAHHLVRPVADYHGAELEVDLRTDDSWNGDPRLVRRILLNLVTNGLEAAGDGGRVTVTVEDGAGADPDTRCIVVSDTGPGIDVERARKLLDPGETEGWKELLDGTDGLGLLIIGRLARAAGGSVDVEGNDSGGTQFTVELPFGNDDGGDDGVER